MTVPDDKVVFLGDAVLKDQPPFIAHADLPAWMEALELLIEFRNIAAIHFVSGRGGTASTSAIKAQLELMEEIHTEAGKDGIERPIAGSHREIGRDIWR